jgi:hypothetical protein
VRGGRGHAEAGYVVEALQVQADRGDPVVVQQRLDDLRYAGPGGVADRQHVRQRQRAALHREVQRDVAALRDDGRAAVDPVSAVLVGPQRGAVEVVEDAVAVRPDQRHVTGGGEQAALQVHAVAADLGEAGGVTDRATGVATGERGDDLDGGLPPYPDEGRVGRRRERGGVGEARQALDRRAAWVHRPQLTGEADPPALPDDLGGHGPAEDRDVPGREEPA